MTETYLPWFRRDPARFEDEKADMTKRGFVLNDEALALHHYVEFKGESKIDGSRPLRIRYPDAFPSFPPTVYSETPGRLLQRHQRPKTWEICVFGPGQPRWSARRMGTEAIDEAEDVIAKYSPGVPLPPDDVPEPASAFYPYVRDAAILIPPPLSSASPTTGGRQVGVFTVRLRLIGKPEQDRLPIRGVVLRTRIGGRIVSADPPFTDWHNTAGATTEEDGILIHARFAPPIFEDERAFAAWLGPLIKPTTWTAIVFPEESGTAYDNRWSWTIIRRNPSGNIDFIRSFPYRSDERVARVPGLVGLESKRVLFIGAGSMGSKIAAGLAASGVTNFILIDPDIYKPENAVRHEAGVEFFGAPKVLALEHRIKHLNPQVRVRSIVAEIGNTHDWEDEVKLFDLVSTADLVVETTGAHRVSRWLNDLCHQVRVDAVYATVTNGAWGGEVVRVIPGQTACWRCWFQEYEMDPPPGAPMPEVGVFHPGCEQPSFTGSTHEVGIVANLAAWMAVETLLRDERGRDVFAGDYIRWVARTESGIPNLAPEIRTVHKRDKCRVCNPG